MASANYAKKERAEFDHIGQEEAERRHFSKLFKFKCLFAVFISLFSMIII